MDKRPYLRILVAVLLAAVTAAGTLYAASSPRWDMSESSLWEEKEQSAWTKLGRGASNVAFGWCEIFRQPALMSHESPYTTSFFGGIPKGMLFAAARMVVGTYEVVTFPFPAPEGYEPIIVPETAVYEN